MEPITPHETTIRIWTAGKIPFAIIPIDLMTDGIRQTFHLMIDIYRTAEGVDNQGTAACLNPTATVIDGRPKEKHPLVMFGQVIHTIFGDFIPQPGRHRDNPKIEILPFKTPK